MSKVAALRAMREARFDRSQQDEAADAALARGDVTAFLDMVGAAKALGAKGGKSKSPAKQAASRNNGKKGGAPKRLG
jgi:hypothetical protein